MCAGNMTPARRLCGGVGDRERELLRCWVVCGACALARKRWRVAREVAGPHVFHDCLTGE